MKPASLLRRYWLEAVCLIALVLPWLAVFLLGFFWLWQQQAMHWWFVAAALLGSPLLLLRYRKKRVRRDEAEGSLDLDLEASPEWGCKEEDAWKMVQEIASKTVPFSFAEIKPIEDAIQLTFGSIAKYYQPNLSRALWQITLPEALLLIERTLNRLRDVVLRYLPGNQYIMISHGIWLRERYNSHWLVYRPILKGLSQLVRLARIATDPSSALAAEIGFLVKSNLSDGITTTVIPTATDCY